MSDNVNHPSHYQTEGGLEVIEIIKSILGDGYYEAYCIGNVLKYVSRYKKKNGLEDLKKARVYLGYVIDHLESKECKFEPEVEYVPELEEPF